MCIVEERQVAGTEGKPAILVDKVIPHMLSPLQAPSVPLKYRLMLKM